jgi:Peptidase family C25
LLPGNVKVNRVDRGRLDSQAAKADTIEAINRGQKIVNYVGHGSVNLWRGNLLTNEDTAELTNADHLSVFIMMTCLNGYFQDAVLDSLAGSLLKARGGAVAVWASSGMTGPYEQTLVNQRLYELLFAAPKEQPLTLGEAAVKAKAATTDPDVRRTWILLGDPAMRIK